jgi:hypothetical protein
VSSTSAKTYVTYFNTFFHNSYLLIDFYIALLYNQYKSTNNITQYEKGLKNYDFRYKIQSVF